jgi:uncharacterized protein
LYPNRDFLLDIKSGKYEYDDLLNIAEKLRIEMDEAFATSTLPKCPDREYINELTSNLREQFYNERTKEEALD